MGFYFKVYAFQINTQKAIPESYKVNRTVELSRRSVARALPILQRT